MRTKEANMKGRDGRAYLLLAGLAVFGCEQDKRSEVGREVEDLRRAEQESPRVVQDLERRLAEAKNEVARVEQKLVLARQGITDDVMKERDELKQALNEQDKHVSREIREAQGAARNYNAESERARQELERTIPAEQVKTQVKTETQVVPGKTEVETQKEQVQIPVVKERVTERERSAGASDPTNP